MEPPPIEPPPIEPPPIEPPPPVEPPPGAHCDPVAEWDPVCAQFEEEVLLLVNQRRSEGADCGSEGVFGPAGPLVMNAELRCSARLHSLDMANRGYFDHTNPDGEDPFDRMAEAGYSGFLMGENIAQGQATPEEVMAGWMESDGHCSNIMQGGYDDIGVGCYGVERQTQWGTRFVYTWTQNFGGTR
jgi:uncharacterized protein YkwD